MRRGSRGDYPETPQRWSDCRCRQDFSGRSGSCAGCAGAEYSVAAGGTEKEGVWVFGTAADGSTSLYNADLKGPAAIIIGSEGSGMSRLTSERCDFLVSIPMKGSISSLNASAAAAILLYEAVRQRN